MRHFLIVSLCLTLVACGGGGASSTPAPTTNTSTSGSQKVVSTGNWTMHLSDGTRTIEFAAMYSQVGAVVTANSFTAAGNPLPFNCVPLTATLANGLVQNVSQFSGDVTMTYDVNFPTDRTLTSSTWHFASTLNDAGTQATGTYSGLASCSGLAASGTFTGQEMPSTTGTWTGTSQQCTVMDATCSPSGPLFQVSMTMNQDNSNGIISGAYTTQLNGYTSGTLIVDHSLQDILSGTVLQFHIKDANGATAVVNGKLGLDRTFKGLFITQTGVYYAVSISH